MIRSFHPSFPSAAAFAALLALACARPEREGAEPESTAAPSAATPAIGGDTALANGAIATDTPASVATRRAADSARTPSPRATTPTSASATARPARSTQAARLTPKQPATARDTPRDTAPATTPTVAQPTPEAAVVTPPAPATPRRASVPFAPGERLVYDVKFGSLDVGDGVMEVVGVENVRGRDAYHTSFRVKGGTLFYKVNDRYESWIDVNDLVSLRHKQQIDEGSYERERHYEIFVERGVYKENEKPEQPTVAQPLDDGSFFYFVRSIPLEVGRTYEFNRYFRPDRNPVSITVLRRERVKVPAGTFDAFVIRPTIKTKGIFGEGGQAEIWLADDSTRAMLQMKSKLKFGSLNLYLKRMRVGTRPGAP